VVLSRSAVKLVQNSANQQINAQLLTCRLARWFRRRRLLASSLAVSCRRFRFSAPSVSDSSEIIRIFWRTVLFFFSVVRCSHHISRHASIRLILSASVTPCNATKQNHIRTNYQQKLFSNPTLMPNNFRERKITVLSESAIFILIWFCSNLEGSLPCQMVKESRINDRPTCKPMCIDLLISTVLNELDSWSVHCVLSNVYLYLYFPFLFSKTFCFAFLFYFSYVLCVRFS